jgi:hypothetical protein
VPALAAPAVGEPPRRMRAHGENPPGDCVTIGSASPTISVLRRRAVRW